MLEPGLYAVMPSLFLLLSVCLNICLDLKLCIHICPNLVLSLSLYLSPEAKIYIYFFLQKYFLNRECKNSVKLMWFWSISVFYVEKGYSKYIICTSNIFPVILKNYTLVLFLCFGRRMWMWLGVESKEEENWRKCYLQWRILKLLEFHLPISAPLS